MDEAANRYPILVLVSIAETLAISVWLLASAVGDGFPARWELTDWQVTALTTVVQLGFVLGTLLAAVMNLADLIPNRIYFSAAALLTGCANLLLLVCDGFWSAAIVRLLSGMLLAGVYPPAMKMVATWFRGGRGLAVGSVVGALTLGKALPYLFKTLGWTDWQWIVCIASAAALLASFLILFFYRDGPHGFEKRPFSLSLLGTVAGNRATRLAIGGYLGHMWELYAMWTSIGIFLAAAAVRFESGGLGANFQNPASAAQWVTLLVFLSGAAGCVLGGLLADRLGRERFVNLAMGVSGSCCLLAPIAFQLGFGWCALVAVVWGFFIVADSAQFSALVTEVCPRHAVGTALTLQTSIGFLITMPAIQWVSWLSVTRGWFWAYPVLALGPVIGIGLMRRLRLQRQHESSQTGTPNQQTG